MFKVPVGEHIYRYCSDQIKKFNFGMRDTANGTRDQQFTGIVGQCVVSEALGMPLIDGRDGCDDGVDIQYKSISIDVKTMGRTRDVKPYYVNNFIGLQLKFATDVLLFCSLNKLTKELTICGWLPKKEFVERADFFPQGTIRYRTDGTQFTTFADLYEIKNSKLNDLVSFEDLKYQLDHKYNL